MTSAKAEAVCALIEALPTAGDLDKVQEALDRRRRELALSPLSAFSSLKMVLDFEKTLFVTMRQSLVAATAQLRKDIIAASPSLKGCRGVPYQEFLDILKDGAFSGPSEHRAYAERVRVRMGLKRTSRFREAMAEVIGSIMDYRRAAGLDNVQCDTLHIAKPRHDLYVHLTTQLTASVSVGLREAFFSHSAVTYEEDSAVVSQWFTMLRRFPDLYRESGYPLHECNTLSGVPSLTMATSSADVTTKTESDSRESTSAAFVHYRSSAISICTRGSSLYSNPSGRKREASESLESDLDSGAEQDAGASWAALAKRRADMETLVRELPVTVGDWASISDSDPVADRRPEPTMPGRGSRSVESMSKDFGPMER